MRLRRYGGWVVVRTLYVSERSLYTMRSVILSQWRERRMAVIWQDLRVFTTVGLRAGEFWNYFKNKNWIGTKIDSGKRKEELKVNFFSELYFSKHLTKYMPRHVFCHCAVGITMLQHEVGHYAVPITRKWRKASSVGTCQSWLRRAR